MGKCNQRASSLHSNTEISCTSGAGSGVTAEDLLLKLLVYCELNRDIEKGAPVKNVYSSDPSVFIRDLISP